MLLHVRCWHHVCNGAALCSYNVGTVTFLYIIVGIISMVKLYPVRAGTCVPQHFMYGQTFNVLPLYECKFIHMASYSDHTSVSSRYIIAYALFPKQGRRLA